LINAIYSFKGVGSMGYRIEYNGATLKRREVRIPRKKRNQITVAVIALLTAALLLWPASRRRIVDIILPGDEEVTTAALNGLLKDLTEGEPMGEAVHTFCVEIIAGGT
jgi:hypothetical protein